MAEDAKKKIKEEANTEKSKSDSDVKEVKSIKAKTNTEAKEKRSTSNEATNSTARRKNTTKVRPKRRSRRDDRRKKEDKEFDQKIVDIRRVTRMYKGGRRMRLSVFVAIGDGKGRVGLGLGKGVDVRAAQQKAFNQAKSRLISVPLQGNTIPHEVYYKKASSKILLKPAVPGTGVVAGSSVRVIAELAGIQDILGKVLGSNNKINNAYATVEALKGLRTQRI